MKCGFAIVILSILFVSCNSDDVFYPLEGYRCLSGTWIGNKCVNTSEYDTITFSDLDVTIYYADCRDDCEGVGPGTIRTYKVSQYSKNSLTMSVTSLSVCGIPNYFNSHQRVIDYTCKDDTLIWEGYTYVRIPNKIPCFEGIWTSDRCNDAKYGKDTLRIDPARQVTLTSADCGNNCGTNGPGRKQVYSLYNYSSDLMILLTLSSTECGQPIAVSNNPMPVGYECKGDTLYWGGIPFLFSQAYRTYPE